MCALHYLQTYSIYCWRPLKSGFSGLKLRTTQTKKMQRIELHCLHRNTFYFLLSEYTLQVWRLTTPFIKPFTNQKRIKYPRLPPVKPWKSREYKLITALLNVHFTLKSWSPWKQVNAITTYVHTWGGIYLDHPGFLKAQHLLLKTKNKTRAYKQKSKT